MEERSLPSRFSSSISSLLSRRKHRAGGDDGLAGTTTPAVGRRAGRFVRDEMVVECWTLGAKPARVTIKPAKDASAVALSSDGSLVPIGQQGGVVSWYRTE